MKKLTKILPLVLLAALINLSGSIKGDDPQPGPTNPPTTITTTWGKIYDNVKITKVEPDGLRITFGFGGIAKVPFTQLSPEIQKEYGYDPDKAKAYASQVEQQRNEAIGEQAKVAVANKVNDGALNNSELKSAQDKLAVLKKAMDEAEQKFTGTVDGASQPVLQDNGTYHTAEFTSGGKMPPYLQQLQQQYIAAKAAYDAQAKVVSDLKAN